MSTNTDRAAPAAVGLLLLLAGCSDEAPESAVSSLGNSWSVTAWGELYEIFPEVEPLAAGEVATAHTHVTILDGFSPMIDGRVEIVLRRNGERQSFEASEALRPGIFNIAISPESPGEYELAFVVTTTAGTEEVRGGAVRVGTADSRGSLTRAPAPRGGTVGGEPLSFLKEEQWRSAFDTAWVQRGTLLQSVEGVARVRPPAGGEATITTPVDAVLLREPWPYLGLRVRHDEPLFRLVPRIASGHSLVSLEATRNVLELELSTAEARLETLRELFEIEATSRRELSEAQTRVDRIAGNLAAAGHDLESARSAREGGSAGATTVTAPFDGEISAVYGSPGEALAAGEPLARFVRTDSVWLEIAVTPQAGRLLANGIGGVVVSFPEGSSLRIDDNIRYVSTAPEVDATTGMLTVLLEVPPSDLLVLGTIATAQVLLREEVEGIIVPASALVDDGGVTVVYLQLSGEEFARQPVQVTARQGDQVLVEGLLAGQRLVTRGGEAIRRSSLMATGEAHGHVH